MRFDTFVAALQGALDDRGVMLPPLELLQSLLVEGRLMCAPSPSSFLPSMDSIWLRAVKFDQPNAAAFRRWLRGKIRAVLAA